MSLEAAERYLQKKTGEAFVSSEDVQRQEVRSARYRDAHFMRETIAVLASGGPSHYVDFESLGFTASDIWQLLAIYRKALGV